jgi:hypothetical protein
VAAEALIVEGVVRLPRVAPARAVTHEASGRLPAVGVIPIGRQKGRLLPQGIEDQGAHQKGAEAQE